MMKRLLLTFSLLFAIGSIATAQQGRNLVLIEEFTNTGCGPCASWSPTLDSCINYRLGDCIAIKYHSAFPNKEDEYYLNEREAMQTRVDYYGVNAVPATFVNGTELGTRTYGFLNQAIDYCMQQPRMFELSVSKQIAGGQLQAKASLTPLGSIDDASRLRLFVSVIEVHIEKPTPFPNGETELNYTMRKMLTPVGGQPFEGATTFEGQWGMDHLDSQQQLGVVAFVQNVETREILATAYSGPEAEGENRMALMSLTDTPDMICTPNYYGKVIFRNDGAGTLTQATLNVRVNGSAKQYDWHGSLDYLERDTLAFDGFTGFDLSEDKNQVEVWFSNVNGTDATSNVATSQFAHSVQASHDVQLKIYTDKKPEEITWKLYDSAGNVVRQGGPYDGQARKFITINLELTHNDCYQIEFLDSGGDGIKGANGNGYYQLFQVDEAGKTSRIAQGDYNGSRHDVFFRLNGALSPVKERLVLFEEFTNTSCDPCAEFSPALDKTIYERMGQMVPITYHYNFPSPTDPFYLAASTDVMARATLYGVTGVPALRVDGEQVGSWGYEDYLDAYVDGAGSVEALVDLDADAQVASDGTLKVDVSVMPKGVADGRDLRLFVAVVEERVEWAQPAANGESAWNYVVRKLLPSPQGQALEADLTQAVPYHYEMSWSPQNFYDDTQLGVVAFVQNMSNRQVLGTVYAPRTTGSPRGIKILKVLNTPNRICSPKFTSDLMVRGTGREPLTSAMLNVSINGQVQQTPWTGRLDYLEIDTISTPLFDSFTLRGDGMPNDVEIWLSQLNGTAEESLHSKLTVANAFAAQHAVRLTLMTDNAPDEITWKLYNSAGDVVAEGGPYTEVRKRHVVDLGLSIDDCYHLEFLDAGGNGITGENGRGYYMLHEVQADGKTRLLTQADYTTAQHDVFFSLEKASTTSLPTVPYTAIPSQSTGQPRDLLGRPATQRSPIIIYQGKKSTTNK